jgi:Ca2+-binding EF-hand superfamily protein
MSLETQTLLTKVLKQQIVVAGAEETLRHSISTQALFNPYESFSVLDTRNKGYLVVDDFRRYLQNEGVSPTERDMQALMSRYDRDGDAKVTYSEFLQEITPRAG